MHCPVVTHASFPDNRECKPSADEKKEEEQKKRTSDLWADFMKDTGFKTRAEIQQETSKGIVSNDSLSCSRAKEDTDVKLDSNTKPKAAAPIEKVVVQEVYDFAGEKVIVNKEVAANSIGTKSNKASLSSTAFTNTNQKKTAGGGLSSVLNQLGKKNKISTLEKSKLDWDKFKKDENIQEELQAYSKSKNG